MNLVGASIEPMPEGFSLTKGEHIGISITEDDIIEVKEQGANCLIGKLWTEKKINNEAFKTVLARIWKVEGSISFKELQDNLWIFKFFDEEIKQRLMIGRPCLFDRQVLALNDFDGLKPPSQMDFSHSPCWIQVHDMPLLCMTKVVELGRYLRLRVNIDLTKPLERGRALLMGGKSILVSFKYEQLPLFCFHCGRIIHGSKVSNRPKTRRMNSTEEEKQWGFWLRVEELGKLVVKVLEQVEQTGLRRRWRTNHPTGTRRLVQLERGHRPHLSETLR